MSRPNRIFEAQLVNEIIGYIEVGNYVPTACAAAGISETTYYRWLSDGQAVEELIGDKEDADDYRERMLNGELVLGLSAIQVRSWEFRQRILMASARSEAYAVATIRAQMPAQWTAAMTFLERRFPGRWKRRDQIDIGEADAANTGIDETLLLRDPQAVKLIHDALDRVAQGEITIGDATEISEPGDQTTP